MIDFIGRSSIKCCVRLVLVVPIEKQLQLAVELLSAIGNEHSPCPLLFHRSDETLNDGNTSVLADGKGSQAYHLAVSA